MRSLIWKECHENLKWAALAALVLGGIVALFRPALMAPELLLFLGPVAAVFATALGFLQVYSEAGGDKRSLLLHRPLSRSRVFLAKAMAGVGLYLLATGLPFACAVAWAATPGHLAEPFRWPTVLPGVADILTGIVYYFAGMLVAQREARWYASRGLPLITALVCSFLVWVVPEVEDAILAIVLLAAPMAIAAWGAFLTGGEYAPMPRVGKASLAATFGIALLVLGVIVKPILGRPTLRANMTRYKVDRAGRVLVVHFRQGEVEDITDSDGRLPSELAGKPLSFFALQDVCVPFSAEVGPKFASYRNPGRFYVKCENNTSRGGERWFYVADQGRLVGYDVQSKRPIGSCGPDGFLPAGQVSAARFDGEPYFDSFLWESKPIDRLSFPGGVYVVDFGNRVVRKLYTPAIGEIVLGAVPAAGEGRTFILTDHSVRVVHRNGSTLFSAPFAVDRDDFEVLRVSQLDDTERWVVRYEPSWFMGTELGNRTPGHLVEYNSIGRELARRILPPAPMFEPSDGQAVLGLATPPAEAALLAWATEHSVASARKNGGREVHPLLFILTVPGQMFNPLGGLGATTEGGTLLVYRGLILLSALTCALICLLLARRYAYSTTRCVVWLLSGLALGPAGLLLMLALEEWPARIACADCGKLRVVNRDMCEHCGAPHASPALDGTEIFQPTAAEASAALAEH